MTDSREIPPIVREISLEGIERIDVGLEGGWGPTVVTVWTREQGALGFAAATRSHPTNSPILELYFTNSWVGVSCFTRSSGLNDFDEEYASRIIEYVASQMAKKDCSFFSCS